MKLNQRVKATCTNCAYVYFSLIDESEQCRVRDGKKEFPVNPYALKALEENNGNYGIKFCKNYQQAKALNIEVKFN